MTTTTKNAIRNVYINALLADAAYITKIKSSLNRGKLKEPANDTQMQEAA